MPLPLIKSAAQLFRSLSGGDNLEVGCPEKTVVSNGRYNRHDILDLLGPIMERFRKDMKSISDITSHALNLTVDSQVKQGIDDWIANLPGKTIWIQRPHGVSRGNQNNIPSIFYFCSLKTTPPPPPLVLTTIMPLLPTDLIGYDQIIHHRASAAIP